MKIVRFEPGNGTSYYVMRHDLTPEDQGAMRVLPGILFGFGVWGDTPYRVYPFLLGIGVMHEDYFQEKMCIPNVWTRVAAMLVFSAITGRPSYGRNYERVMWDVLTEWKTDWQEQLVPVTLQGDRVP